MSVTVQQLKGHLREVLEDLESRQEVRSKGTDLMLDCPRLDLFGCYDLFVWWCLLPVVLCCWLLIAECWLLNVDDWLLLSLLLLLSLWLFYFTFVLVVYVFYGLIIFVFVFVLVRFNTCLVEFQALLASSHNELLDGLLFAWGIVWCPQDKQTQTNILSTIIAQLVNTTLC